MDILNRKLKNVPVVDVVFCISPRSSEFVEADHLSDASVSFVSKQNANPP